MRRLGLATLLAFAFTSTGCFLFNKSPTPEELNQQFDNAPPKRLIARYDPLAGILPYPSNIVFSGTADGTINIPVDDPDDYAVPQVVLNSLDGFSTMQPMTFIFNGIVDETTVIAGDTVRVFEVKLFSFFLYVTDVVRELEAPNALLGQTGEYTTSVFTALDVGPDGVEGTADDFVYDGVTINPTVPLKAETAYVAVVTNSIRDTDGARAKYDLVYGVSKGTIPLIDGEGHTVVEHVEGAVGSLGDDQASALEPLRKINSSFEAAVAPYGITAESIIMSFGFTTQSVATMLQAIADNLEPGDIHIGPTIDATGARVTTSQTLGNGIGDVFLGTLDVPYYLSPNSSGCHYENEGMDGAEDCPAISSRWVGYQGNFPTRFYYIGGGYGPEQMGTESVPFFMTVPNASSGCTQPAEGWPVNMFVHTMTQARWNMFAISDIISAKCVAGFAMDLPMHGINKMSGNADKPGCEGALDALYAFSADAPASYVNKTCSCNVESDPAASNYGEAVYSMTESDGLGIYQLMPWFNDVRGTVRERTLGVDRTANFPVDGETNGPDGIADSSGAYYFNPAAMLTTRDNMRQSVVDLMVAARSIPTVTNTWSGTLYGLGVQLSAAGLIPDGCMPPGASSPTCGPMFEVGAQALFTYDPDDSLHALLGPTWESPADQMIASLMDAGAKAGAIISGVELTDAGSPVPTSGLLYDAIKAMTIASQVTDAYLGSCATSNAATISATVVATMDMISGAGANLSPAGAWSLGILGAVDAYTVPYITADDVAAALGSATTGAEALQAASDNSAAALGAAVADISSGALTADTAAVAEHAADIPPQLGNYIATFQNDSDTPDFIDGVATLGTSLPALQALGGITTDGCAGGAPACLGVNTGNISEDTRTALLETYLTVAGAQGQAAAILGFGQAGWEALVASAEAELVDVENGATTVAGASAAVDGALAAYSTAGADAQTAMGAFLLGGCANPADLAPLGATVTAAGNLLNAIGGVALSVSAMADEVVNQVDVTDGTTLMGPTATLLGAAQGAIDGLTALSGATGDITTALTAWDEGTPIFDASRISVTGHGVGAGLAFVAATMEPGISQVAMAAPSGSLAYSFEYSDTVRPLLVDGLKAAADLDPDTPLWNTFFAVLQTALDQADPMNFIEHLDDHQAVLMIELENDDFFPAEVASRPLAGSSVLAREIGLERIASSYDPAGDTPVRAVTRLNTDDSWGVHATFLAPYFGCVENACGEAELDLACNAANEELRQEAWSQIGSFLSSAGRSVSVNGVGGGTGNSLIDEVD